MGHLRTGALPRSRRWSAVVASVEAFSSGSGGQHISDIADKTLDASSQVLRKLPFDQSLQYCFQFLTALAVAGQSKDVRAASLDLGIDLGDDPTKLQLSRALRDWIEKADTRKFNPEYEGLARQATVDTIVAWINSFQNQPQLNLISQSKDSFQPWREASDGRKFCELSRLFFSNFTSLYLKYFLSRTASAQLQTISEREKFESSINAKVDTISQHAFETSKLVQSFSAGWFNKNAIGKLPSLKTIEGFLRHSLDKIREELRREMEAR
jgi:hypothetical protein